MADAANPYAAPDTDIASGPELPKQHPLAGWGIDQVKRLSNASQSIRALGALGFVVCVMMAVSLPVTLDAPTRSDLWFGVLHSPAVLFPYTVLIGIAVVIAFRRPGWGRIYGIVVCSLSLIFFPFGTLFGYFGILAFAQGKLLFGSNRVTHGEIVKLFKAMKAEQKARARAAKRA